MIIFKCVNQWHRFQTSVCIFKINTTIQLISVYKFTKLNNNLFIKTKSRQISILWNRHCHNNLIYGIPLLLESWYTTLFLSSCVISNMKHIQKKDNNYIIYTILNKYWYQMSYWLRKMLCKLWTLCTKCFIKSYLKIHNSIKKRFLYPVTYTFNAICVFITFVYQFFGSDK